MTFLTRIAPPMIFGSRRAALLVERNIYVYRRTLLVIFSGFFEPLFYLLSIGLGIGGLIGTIPGPDGRPIPYELFVAPALLATSAMNGAIYDSTFNVFFKLNYEKTYDAVLATPLGVGDVALGEIAWALIRRRTCGSHRGRSIGGFEPPFGSGGDRDWTWIWEKFRQLLGRSGIPRSRD